MIVKVLDKKAPDALVIPLAQDENLPKHLSQIAQRAGFDPAALQTDFRAEAKEVFVLYAANNSGQKFYLLGLGKNPGFENVYANSRAFCFHYKSKLPLRLGLDLRHFPEDQLVRTTDAAVTGILLGLYNIGLFRTKTDTIPNTQWGASKSELHLLVPSKALADSSIAAKRGEVFADTLRQVLNLVNAPGNQKNPEILTDWAVRAAKESGVKVRILGAATLRQEGLEALLAVGKGSPHPPTMLWLEYGSKSRKNPVPVFGLVGKGITFDTGGISIKPSANMQYMKSDMGGAAAVLGAFMVAAQLKLPVRMVGAIPIAENMVDGIAIKPGDVISSYSGKTIEVADTDAEGRLILADGLAYLIKREKPDVLIDVATLTGSVIRTLGYAAAGVFTKNNMLSETLRQAGEDCGERLWPFPMWDSYAADLKSDVADLRNFTGKPMAEAISAAKFIEFFTADHPVWAHLDIAGVAFGDTELGKTKNATGFGVRLLVEFMEQWTANQQQ